MFTLPRFSNDNGNNIVNLIVNVVLAPVGDVRLIRGSLAEVRPILTVTGKSFANTRMVAGSPLINNRNSCELASVKFAVPDEDCSVRR